MNKIKLMYDVVRKMKEKEAFKGSLKVQANKNGSKVFGFENEFEKNTAAGQGKSSYKTEFECNDKKFKHESSTEFNFGEGHGPMHHRMMGRFHGHMRGHMHGHMQGEHDFGGCSMKDKLNRIAFGLSIFNAVQLEEKEAGAYVLTLNSNDIPEDLRKELHEGIKKHHEQMKSVHNLRHAMHNEAEGEEHACMMKELHSMEDHNLILNVFINQNSEIEKVTVQVNGKLKGGQDETGVMELNAELKLQ